MDMILPIVFIIVGIVLIWFVVELAITVRKARIAIDEVKKEVDPIIANANQIIDDLQPAVAKVDPLVERLQLTVDAANLELMRIDEILEDVGEATDSLSSVSNAVDKVAQAPVAAVEGVSTRLRDVFKPRRASSVSRALGGQKETQESAVDNESVAFEAPAAADDTPAIPVVSDESEEPRED